MSKPRFVIVETLEAYRVGGVNGYTVIPARRANEMTYHTFACAMAVCRATARAEYDAGSESTFHVRDLTDRFARALYSDPDAPRPAEPVYDFDMPF